MATTTADALPVIDLRLFTQSDLRALSKSTTLSDFSSRFDADVSLPKIDRAVFNESAGSRKQTYSRLRLAPRNAEVSGGSRIGETRVEKADELENRRIVAMLKELVGEESGDEEVFEGLVAVEVECVKELEVSDPEMMRQEVRVEVGSVEPVKRKRGRPRKDESQVYVNKIVLNDESDDADEFGFDKVDVSHETKGKRNGKEKEKRDEDDMEMGNKNGVVVDIVALGNVDDPFGQEIRRRTEGMSTKEELLEFLNGLEGQWVSRRRKRKIVDACAFGDFLPIGWKLVFSIKKKAGHAWLICRQYISPSGREFISSKEVSSYLQHLFGVQSEEHKISIGNMPADKVPDEHVGNQVVNEDLISDQPHSGSLVTSLASQVLPDSEIALSHVVNNDVPQHISQSTPKKRIKRRKLGARTLISDGVIITDGKFECQFCHKIFDERRRYNGHVGIHVRSVEAMRGSETNVAGTSLDLVGVRSVASGLNITETFSSGAQANHIVEGTSEVVNLEFLHPNLVGVNEAGNCTDKGNAEMPILNVEVSQDIIDKTTIAKSYHESEKEYMIADDVAGTLGSSFNIGDVMSQCGVLQTNFDNNELHTPGEKSGMLVQDIISAGEHRISEKSSVVYNAVGRQSNDDDAKSNKDSDNFGEKLMAQVESVKHAVPTEKPFSDNNAGDFVRNGNEEHTVDFTEQFDNEKSPFSLGGIVDNKQENMPAFYQQRSVGNSLIASFLNTQIATNSENETVASGSMECKEKISEEDLTNLLASKQTSTVNNNFLDDISEKSCIPLHMHPNNSGIQPVVTSTGSPEELGVNDWCRDNSQKIFGVTYLFPSSNQNLGTTDVQATSMDVIGKSPWKSHVFNPQLTMDNVDKTSNAVASNEFWKPVDVPSNSVANKENEAPPGAAAIINSGHGKSPGGYPFSSHGNELGFNIRNDMVGMGDRSVQESRPERDYASDFVNQFENGQSSQGGFQFQMFPTRPVEQRQSEEVRFPLNSELNISLGNNHSGHYAVNQSLKGQSRVLSGNEHFGLQNSTNSFYHSSVEEPRDQRASGSSLMDQFAQQQLFGLQSNANQAYNGSMWRGQRLEGVGNFGASDMMAGFGSGQPQRSENVLNGGNWRGLSAHGLSGSSMASDQPSGYLHNLQMMSNKGNNQLFDVAQKFNNIEGFQDQQGGIQQREYNFLNAQAKPYTQEPNAMPYQQQMQQSFDPALWLGRQTPFPQVPASSSPTASCVWCSNMFYQESLNSFNQADTIVPTCPSCKAKMSEQLNLF